RPEPDLLSRDQGDGIQPKGDGEFGKVLRGQDLADIGPEVAPFEDRRLSHPAQPHRSPVHRDNVLALQRQRDLRLLPPPHPPGEQRPDQRPDTGADDGVGHDAVLLQRLPYANMSDSLHPPAAEHENRSLAACRNGKHSIRVGHGAHVWWSGRNKQDPGVILLPRSAAVSIRTEGSPRRRWAAEPVGHHQSRFTMRTIPSLISGIFQLTRYPSRRFVSLR